MGPFKALPTIPSSPTAAAAKVTSVVHRARSNFTGRMQGAEESVGGYAEALQILGMKCEYKTEVLEEAIRNQFIFGLKGKAIQDHLREQDDSLTLTKLISIAIAAEDYQNERFGYQHPLLNQEIQHALESYLGNHDLLEMRLVSKACKRLAEEELCRRQRKFLREYRWSHQSRFDRMSLKRFILKFESKCQIKDFIRMFGNQKAATPTTRWPFFGEGIVNFESYVTKAKYVIKFLKTFGTQVTMLIWWNDNESASFSEFKTALRLTPNLRTLWIGWKGKLPVEIFKSGNKGKGLPKLPFLDSVYCAFNQHFWMAYLVFRAYGSQLTALNLSQSIYLPSLIEQFSSGQNSLLPLTNVQELTIDGYLPDLHQLDKHTDWKLRKLSITIGTFANLQKDSETYMGLDDYVKESDVVWRLINQSRESLREVYFDNCFEDWKDFIQFFLLPVFHNPAYKSLTCMKVRKLSLRFMYLMKARRVLQVICSKFPNVEHIEFTYLEEYPLYSFEDFVKIDQHLVPEYRMLLESARNLFFEEADYTFPIPWTRLSQEIFAHLWNKLGSLRKVTVLCWPDGGPEKMKVVFKQSRKDKGHEITTTITSDKHGPH